MVEYVLVSSVSILNIVSTLGYASILYVFWYTDINLARTDFKRKWKTTVLD